jgi:hypothetical protein
VGALKTTVNIPDELFHRLREAAVCQQRPMQALVSEAIAEKLRRPAAAAPFSWKRGFGKLRHLRRETRRIQRFLAEDEAEWRAAVGRLHGTVEPIAYLPKGAVRFTERGSFLDRLKGPKRAPKP